MPYSYPEGMEWLEFSGGSLEEFIIWVGHFAFAAMMISGVVWTAFAAWLQNKFAKTMYTVRRTR